MAAELTISSDGEAIVLDGEIDTHTAPQLGEHLATIADGSDVILDMRGVQFISSAGLSVTLNAQRRLSESGGSLVLRAPTTPVRRVIELSGLAETLGVS